MVLKAKLSRRDSGSWQFNDSIIKLDDKLSALLNEQY